MRDERYRFQERREPTGKLVAMPAPAPSTTNAAFDVLSWLLDQPCPACNKLSAWMTHTTSAISCTACGFLITLEHFQLILAAMMTGELRGRRA